MCLNGARWHTNFLVSTPANLEQEQHLAPLRWVVMMEVHLPYSLFATLTEAGLPDGVS